MEGTIVCLLAIFVGGISVREGAASNKTKANPIPEAKTFVGAVVNFEPSFGLKGSPELTALTHAAAFGLFAQRAAATGAEVVVFPEGALHGGAKGGKVPLLVPPMGYNFCAGSSNANHIMTILSCAAYSASVYLVAAIDEALDHTHSCGAQIVFDPNGILIARHRQRSCGGGVDGVVYFTLKRTGLKVGLLLSADLFDDDLIYRLKGEGVNHYALSFTNLDPNFGTSLQIQQWWSYSRNVVLMASGLTRRAEYDPHSGTYTGRNKGRCLPQQGDRGLVVAEISNRTADPPVCLNVDWNSEIDDGDTPPHHGTLETATMLLVTNELSGKWTKLCQNDFCCDFYVETYKSDQAKTGYKLVLFAGPSKNFGPSAFLNQCGLLACEECPPIDIVTFSIVSNIPGLKPNVLTNGDPSPKLRFSGGDKPKLSANEDIDSVEWAILRSVKYDNSTTDSSSTVGEPVQHEEANRSEDSTTPGSSTSTPSTEDPPASPEETTKRSKSSTAITTGKREVDFMQQLLVMNSRMAENAKHMQENMAHNLAALQHQINAAMIMNSKPRQ